MAHVTTTGTLPNSTASTGTQQALTGQADHVHIRVDNITYAFLADNTDSTGTSTDIGMILATGVTHHFWAGSPPPTYIYWVATGAGAFSIIETF